MGSLGFFCIFLESSGFGCGGGGGAFLTLTIVLVLLELFRVKCKLFKCVIRFVSYG